MSNVDNKVVSITFDNATFQRKLDQTLSSLDRLSKSLELAGAKQGLSDVSAAASKFSMAEMSSSIEGVSAKFAALATVGITALANLTNKAVDAGIAFGKSLTFDQISGGFGEFELKMGSIQTIMAGSGESLDVVNQKLNELNAYSDRTIYSFADMTSNIGKFTNAGVSLDQAVGSIQGVANVAALAGANSEEASRAMYNFAQALSTGSVKLIDWKSIELANMGTVEFKQQIMDTAVAMGTLKKATDGTYKTMKGTTVTTKNFQTTLNEAWFTSDVLTGTLNKFSDETTEIGQRAAKAATEIKTFSQLVDTMKEGVGSGWAMTFEHIFGNFEEGIGLWTLVNDSFGKILSASADARNGMLKDWKDLGGRGELLQGIIHLYQGVKSFIVPIRDAFREIFPRKTGKELYDLTVRFKEWAQSIKIAGSTANKIKTFFKGFFAIIDIGWEIFKGIVRVVFTLAKGLWAIVGPILGLVSGSGALASGLHSILVEGGGIEKFFDMLIGVLNTVFGAIGAVVSKIVEFVSGLGLITAAGKALGAIVDIVQRAASAIRDFFSSINLSKGAKEGVEETGKSVEKTAGLFDKLLAALKNVFSQIGDFLSGIWNALTGFFSGLGSALASAIGSGDFNQVLNIIKTGLLGGILVMLRKFFKHGIKLDFGQDKLFEKIGDILDTVTASLKTLQASVRADILFKIASAMGILTLSIIALSLIDSAKLAKAMGAMAVGFTQLTAVLLILEKMAGSTGSIKLMAMSVSMIALAGAMTVLSTAMWLMSRLSWEELAKGLVGVSVGMIMMATASRIMAKDNVGMVRAGIAMIAISVALIVLAKAIKSFAEMNLGTMAWGLAQAAIGIGLLIAALKLMPDDIAKKGIGLLILAFSLRSLAKVVQLFAGIAFGTLAKGFIAISLGLAAIGIAMKQFPDDMIQKAVGLGIVSGALYLLGIAIQKVGSLPFGELIKGVLGLSVMLGVLAAAIVVMDQARGGIAGLLLAAVGLLVIGRAIKEVGSIPFGELIKGLLGLAAVLAVLAIASLVAPGIALLGAALILVGAGLALVGAGVALAGKGIELFAKYGAKALGFIIDGLQAVIKELPQFVSAFVIGLLEAGRQVAEQAPKLVGTIAKIFESLLDAILKIIPKLKDVLIELITAGLEVLIETSPKWAEAGVTLILDFLTAILEKVPEFTNTLAEAIIGFIEVLSERAPEMIESLVELFTTVITSLAYEIGKLAPSLTVQIGIAFIQGFWDGIKLAVGKVFEFVKGFIQDIIGFFKSGFGIFSPSRVMIDIGKNIIQGLINGVKSLVGLVSTFFIELPLKVIGWIGNTLLTLGSKGVDLLKGLLNGINQFVGNIIDWFTSLPGKIAGWIGNVSKKLVSKGISVLRGFFSGILEKVRDIKEWFQDLPKKILGWIGDLGGVLLEAGKELIGGLAEGVKGAVGGVAGAVGGAAKSVIGGIGGALGLGGPSKIVCEMGRRVGESLAMGISDDKAIKNSMIALKKTVMKSVDSLSEVSEFQPRITPVLDLSKVQAGSKNIDGILTGASINPVMTAAQARYISAATATRPDDTQTPATPEPREIKFEQNIYAPEALSTNDIYRNTKSQIARAKEELGVS